MCVWDRVSPCAQMRSTEGERVLIMAATNRPHELDDAALRSIQGQCSERDFTVKC